VDYIWFKLHKKFDVFKMVVHVLYNISRYIELERRLIDNIKMGLLGIGVSVVYWFCLAQDRYK
jgi:hypothetical protein